MYAEFLRYKGISTIAVSNGEEALGAAVNADVIVTGMRIPRISGAELIRRLRKDDTTRDKPIIALTASVLPADRELAAAAGCDVFLRLPCSPAALLQEIQHLTARR